MRKTWLAFGLAATLMAGSALAADYKPQRTADGHPSFEGNWSNATTTRLERDNTYGDRLAMTEAELQKIEGATAARNAQMNKPTDLSKGEAGLPECQSGATGAGCGYNAAWTDPGDKVMRVKGQGRTSFITYPANGRVPAAKAGVRPAGRGGALRPGMSQNDNPEGRSLGERCIMSFGNSSGPIMQPQLYNNNYGFVQTKDELAIWVEMVHDVRHVRIGAKHRTDGVREYMGDSIGWWEGDTLVVETINYHPSQGFRGSDANLKVTEKFTRTAKDRLLYQFKIEDPTVWDTAWGGEYEFAEQTGQVYEYACHEGNYGLENILSGARAEEAEAKAKTAAK
ncbi:hypothetical protein BH11PSE2_BH11PSE2_21490 [soil metagenome]